MQVEMDQVISETNVFMIEIELTSYTEKCVFIFSLWLTKPNQDKNLEDIDMQDARWDQENRWASEVLLPNSYQEFTKYYTWYRVHSLYYLIL